MILEWLEKKFTPASKLARDFGLVYHSVALKYRYQRCRRAWSSHIQNCHHLIRKIVDKTPKKNHLVILGSAHLHEIPKGILEKEFKQVTLVDLVHPISVRRWARKFPHVKLVEQDLSGFLEKLKDVTDSEVLLKEVQSTSAPFHFSADLIISSNLISQLHLIAIDYLAKKKILATEDFNDRIGQAFSLKHLEALQNCNGKVLLYGDRETIYRDVTRRISYRGSFKLDMAGFKYINKWTWDIAPIGEYSRRESIEMMVEAYSTDP